MEGLRVYPGEVLRGEPEVEGDPKMVGDKGEASHREAKPPLPEYHVGIVGSRTLSRIIAGEKFENV